MVQRLPQEYVLHQGTGAEWNSEPGMGHGSPKQIVLAVVSL